MRLKFLGLFSSSHNQVLISQGHAPDLKISQGFCPGRGVGHDACVTCKCVMNIAQVLKIFHVSIISVQKVEQEGRRDAIHISILLSLLFTMV